MTQLFPRIDPAQLLHETQPAAVGITPMKNQFPTQRTSLLCSLIAACLLNGCARQVRSISNSGYQAGYVHAALPARELDEFDVLGLGRDQPATEADIQRATREARRVQLAPGSTILLIQSGAIYPDGPMVTELGKHFSIVPFTGLANEPKPGKPREGERTTRNAVIVTGPDRLATLVPLSTLARDTYHTPPAPRDPGAYSRTLRLAAARGGATTVVCYWGILESGCEEIATKTVTWLPVVNWIVPDEKQHMRIKLKVAVVDVASGSWSVFSVQPSELSQWNRRPRRAVADQKLVELLKAKAYELAANELVNSYASHFSAH